MTRLWIPFGRRVLLLIVLLVTLIALFPLRLALSLLDLDRIGVSARSVSGSIWSGRLDEVAAAGVPIGSVQARLSPLELLLGRARIDVKRPADAGGAGPLSGAVTVSRNSLGVADVAATLPLAAALSPLPIASVTLTGFNVRFDGQACTRASGTARATLTGSVAGVALAQGLNGTPSCDGRYVRIPLASQSGQERLELRVAIDGEYIADLIAVQPAPDRIAALAALGFTEVPGGYRLRTTGRFE